MLELAGQSCSCHWPSTPGPHNSFARGQKSAGQPGKVWEGSRGSQPVHMPNVACQARLRVILDPVHTSGCHPHFSAPFTGTSTGPASRWLRPCWWQQ